MSRKTSREWLLSLNSNQSGLENEVPTFGRLRAAKTIAVTSGKGGVGKTSISLKIAKNLTEIGNKVLLVDCDYNLANTAVKLGFPLENNYFHLLKGEMSFEDAIHKDGNFHLLSACNGNLDLFEDSTGQEALILDVLSVQAKNYDYIILDTPAGLSKNICSLASYCDERYVVVTPDKSSVTDSYSLIKVLNQKYGVKENGLIFNKISHEIQLDRLKKTFIETVSHFLDCRLKVVGTVPFYNQNIDSFDRELLKVAGSKIDKAFFKLTKNIVDEDIDTCKKGTLFTEVPLNASTCTEQEVHTF